MKPSNSQTGSRTTMGSLQSFFDPPRHPPRNDHNLKSTRLTDNNKINGNHERSQNREDNGTPAAKTSFVPWRVFINHIDSYHGKKLAELLSGEERTAGEDDVEEEDEGDEYDSIEEDREEQMSVPSHKNVKMGEKLEIIGTVRDEEYKCPEDVAVVIPNSKNRQTLLCELMKCGVVIYDITQDDNQIEEANWALEAIVEELSRLRKMSPKAFEESRETRYFILISTLMTWALTKPLDPEDPDLPLGEADYRKRKPHPNFKEHIKCERNVTTAPKRNNLKNKFKTIIVGAGITYGDEEGPLHYLFKMAWNNADFLPIFGTGTNTIPLLHVRDLAKVVLMIIKKWPKLRYIVAAEQELISQMTIVKKISSALTTGKVESLSPEEAFLLPEVSQRSYDMINVNMNIEPGYIVDNDIGWHSEMPFRDIVDSLVEDYKKSRNLRPVKVIVLGPPASGKTYLAARLAKHYGIHHIQVKSLIEETIQNLTNEIENAKDITRKDSAKVDFKDLDAEEDGDEDEIPGIDQLEKELDEIRNNLAENNGRLSDDILTKLFIKRLESKDCQNQGYVLDGYPKTLSQTEKLFESDEDRETEEIEEDDSESVMLDTKRKIMPELIVLLEGDDEFLIERVIRLPEKEVQGTHYNEEGMLRRLKEYRNRNTDEESPLDFFNEREIHPLDISIENDTCPEMFSAFVQCIDRLGEPRNYGPSFLEREQAKKRIEAEARAKLRIENARKEREDFERRKERQRKMREWTDLLDKLKQEEDEQLCAMVEPLRHYLVKYIFPTLTKGLIEVAKLRPEDPIDFLAEFLFRENPEGKMFEPDYTETMSKLMDAIEKLQEKILPSNELEAGNEKYLKDGEQGGRYEAEEVCTINRGVETEILTEDDEDDEKGEKINETDTIPSTDLKSSAKLSPKKMYKDESDTTDPSKFSYEQFPAGSRNSIESSSYISFKNLPQ